MGNYALHRVFLFIPTLLLATILVFGLFWIVPGDAAMMLLTGDEDAAGKVTNEDIDRLREKMGLNRPIHVQYSAWVWDLMKGDLGDSLWYKTPVLDDLKDRFPITIQLATMALLMAFVAAVPLGIISAVKQDTAIDYFSRIFALIGIAMPSFWLGILMVYALAYWFKWLPPLEYANIWEDPWLNMQQLFFPALALAFHDMAFTARVTRSSMLEVLREDYMRTARSKGLREFTVIGRHALKNALMPVVTISGYQFGRLLGGVIIIESIFVIPGIGLFLVDAIIHRDFIVLQGVVLLAAATVLVLNLVIDLFYGVLDPRIRYS
ncbi:MAG: ABC transporter permease [Chloroflexi bacterium]|nr:ABC transporter permease [Chloroflexota bacterium]